MADIKQIIYDVIATTFNEPISEINDNLGPGDLVQWDSLGQIQLISALENAFETKLSIDQIISINSIRDINTIFINDSISTYPETYSSPDSQYLFDKPILTTNEPTLIQSTSLPPNSESKWESFRVPPVLHIGPGAIDVLKINSGSRVGIITGERTKTLANDVQDRLPNSTKIFIILRPSGEPQEDAIKEGAKTLAENQVDTIIAVGGGSTIDFAKLSWALYEHPNLSIDEIGTYFQIPALRNEASFIAIPTLFGSGSEASSTAVFTKNKDTKKSILISHEFIPDEVILDPNLSVSSPKILVVSGIFDGLTHAIEGFVSPAKNTIAKSYAAPAIQFLFSALDGIQSYNNITIEILSRAAKGTYWASFVQNHCSVGLAHSLAHQLSGILPHSMGTALFLIPVIEANSTSCTSYQELAIQCGYSSLDSFITKLKAYYRAFSIAPSADQFSAISRQQNDILQTVKQDITFKTNPVFHSNDAIRNIITAAMNQR